VLPTVNTRKWGWGSGLVRECKFAGAAVNIVSGVTISVTGMSTWDFLARSNQCDFPLYVPTADVLLTAAP
jgi:hypothetical protein